MGGFHEKTLLFFGGFRLAVRSDCACAARRLSQTYQIAASGVISALSPKEPINAGLEEPYVATLVRRYVCWPRLTQNRGHPDVLLVQEEGSEQGRA
jgi:hypothetical protein